MGGARQRIYFSSRDASNRSSVGWIEIDMRQPTKVLAKATAPVLSPGPRGAFDDSGVTVSCIVREGDSIWLYYLGWNLGVTVPFRNSIGLAVSRDGIAFERVSPAPVLDRNPVDPYSISYPFVVQQQNEWRMWYGSNLNWGAGFKEMNFVIKSAHGSDAMTWKPTGTICIRSERPGEFAFARPSLILDGGLWRMWYSYGGEQYRIGYAESKDGESWTRLDEKGGLQNSPEGWDAQAVEYPWVFDHDGERYMLYNGDGYGRTGFGLAILHQD
jgi:predicted GH43/DUF377 family glycosyl hydrolase